MKRRRKLVHRASRHPHPTEREEEHPPSPDAEALPESNPTIAQELRAIYAMDADEQASTAPMSKLDIVTQPVLRRVLIAVLLVLIAVAAGLTGSLLLNNPLNGSREMLTFDINASTLALTSGTQTVLTIPYHNPGTVPLANLELIAHLPETFIVRDVLPAAISTTPYTWNLGAIDQGERGEVSLRGVLFGTPGSAVTVQTIARYEPANFSSPFEDIVSKSLLVENSAYTVSVSGPDRAIPEEVQTYVIRVDVAPDAAADRPVELEVRVPTGLTLFETSHEPIHDDATIWRLEPEAFAKPFVLELKGRFSSDIGTRDAQTLEAIVVAPVGEHRVEQARDTMVTDVLASDLSLSLIANGEAGDSIMLPGDDLIVNVALRNRGEEAAEHIALTLTVESGANRVDLAGRAGIPDGTRQGNAVVWDEDDLSRLETLRGTEDASIDVSIPTRDDGADTIVLRAEASVKTVGGLNLSRTVRSNTLTVRIASDIQAVSRARYYDSSGNPVGSGPMPPRALERTTYRVSWSLSNGLHDVHNVQMTALLPPRASWGGIVSVTDGVLQMDPISNRVRWSLDALAAGASPPIAVFDVHVNPTPQDVGTFVDMLGTANVVAEDTVTGSTVRAESPALTTELPDDLAADGQGVVLDI